ncbi:prolyl oligopeptidase family serine peptidase [Candidatus Sulfidibacterium hydrothermale]|uniref:prolyl oligopeptidase family serine peptidase n=1 Tax=Candidatus Sulfidibacterium hydrothermale TaxID=2875962 RepID=UPI001F0ADA4D|nr:prolyl oligopeptidase family serine peptidase [Candidatus Sulfidibacterium hydrothermale]UBM61293.1 prolyl oligopeptidase family serine peptidase [Candidatus Sulfidibacterium hydrothermale]
MAVVVMAATQPLLSQKYEPVYAPKKIVYDTFFNKYVVADPYRWLENVNSKETRQWVQKENKLSKAILTKATFRTHFFRDLEKYSLNRYRTPVKLGKYYFSYSWYDNTTVPALFYRRTIQGEPMLLVDPTTLTTKSSDVVMLHGYSVSKDSKYLAFLYNINGSDWRKIGVVNLETGKKTNDHLTGIKFSGLVWRGHGFYYSVFSQNGKFGSTLDEKVYYHRVGTPQKEDQLIFQRKNPATTYSYRVTSDERFLVIEERNQTTGKENIYYIDYQSKNPHIQPLITHIPDVFDILDYHDGKFIARSAFHANNGSVVLIDPAHPYQFQTLVPEYSEALLLAVHPFAERLICVYQSNQHPILTVYNYSGKLLYTMKFPVSSTLSGFYGGFYDSKIIFYFTSYTIPPVVYQFDLHNLKLELTDRTEVHFNYKNIVYKEVEYPSKDSVQVPMILIYEKGLKRNGNNPTILKAYGGFGIVSSGHFDPGIVNFIHHGGIFAFANIRGGGDKGWAWASAGRGINKQKSFDDFIAAAEYLIREGYTNRNKLGITGASNGGLVVAVAAIQRPDLFKVVVPQAAPLDMLRFERFTVGHWHTDEYGSVSDTTGFKNLLSYSPYQNIKDSVNYPTMLVITADNDDRVPPFHSYKFVARLQNRPAQKNMILLKSRHHAGHYSGSTRNMTLRETADVYGFMLYELTKKEKEK